MTTLTDRPKIAIEPIQAFFHNWFLRRDMTRVEQDMAFLRIGHTQKTKKLELGRLYREHEIIAAIQH